MNKYYHVAIVGATGAVGAELLQRSGTPILSGRQLAASRLRARSAGRTVDFAREAIPLRRIVEQSFEGIDHRIFQRRRRHLAAICSARARGRCDCDRQFALSSGWSRTCRWLFQRSMATMFSNIAASLPIRIAPPPLRLMAFYPLHRAFGVRRIFAASYQAVSGSGARAIAELKHQIESAAQNRAPARRSFPASHRI